MHIHISHLLMRISTSLCVASEIRYFATSLARPCMVGPS